jgi:hypothetical protein
MSSTASPSRRVAVPVEVREALTTREVVVDLRPSTLLPALFCLGAALLISDYAWLPPAPANQVLFWAGILTCFAAVALAGLQERAVQRTHVLGLAALGAVLWIPYLLRSPAYPIFVDDLFHLQVLHEIAVRAHTDVPVTLYPIPGAFPGLEFCALAVHETTGLSLLTSGRIVALAVHVALPVLAYLLAWGIGLGRRSAFVAALVYMTNTSYYFFHSAFAYETLSILLVLATGAVLALSPRRGIGRKEAALLAVLVLATTATHHVSSYLLAVGLALTWLVTRLLRRPQRGLGAITALALVAPVAWLLLRAPHTQDYLSSAFSARIHGVVDTLTGEHGGGRRQLFGVSTVPRFEQFVDRAYPVVLAALAVAGLWGVHRSDRWRRNPLLAALAVLGPLAFLGLAPLVITPASDVVYRSWPFVFIGLAVYAAVGLATIVRRQPHVPWAAAGVLVALLLFCGISIGDNQAGRFPSPQPKFAAGPGATTEDVIAAAQWLEAEAGPLNVLAADSNTAAVFATYGSQRALGWGNWTPFILPTRAALSGYLRRSDIRYIVVDKRITTLPPRYGSYFGGGEPRERVYAPGRPFPRSRLKKFRTVPRLSLVYDNGDIQIYRAARSAGDGGRG